MRSITFLAALLFVSSPTKECHSMVVHCTNCSEMFTQMLDRITNMEQLTQLYQQVDEAMKQTQSQSTMVQQGFDMFSKMVQNTNTLSGPMRSKLLGAFGQLSTLTRQLAVQRGDASALSSPLIFTDFLGQLRTSQLRG